MSKSRKNNGAQFLMFMDLPESVQFQVVSFVATAPLERIFDSDDFRNAKGTLAGALPFVCKKMNEFCSSDRLWQASLERASSSDPAWRQALARMAPNAVSNPKGRLSAIRESANVSTYKNLYQVILNEHIRVRLPIFFMPMNFDDDARYQLHLFEPRYRLMMAELMSGYNNESLEGNRPVFLHVVDMRGPHAEAAALVQVMSCAFARDGRCLVDLQVVGSVKLRRCWVRPESFSLYYGDGYRCDGLPLAEPTPLHWARYD